MASFNKVILAGNITRPPELRYTPAGKAVCEIGLAVNEKWTDAAGEKRENVCFVDCTAWAGTAETISKHLRKGDPILLEGKLRLESWEDKNTKEKRSKLSVNIESFSFIGGRSKKDGE